MKLKKVAMAAGGLVVGAGLYFQFSFLPNHRLYLEDMSTATHQIVACVDQFILENPDRPFVQFDDLIGPGKYVMAAFPAAGEDYHEMFPFRVDCQEFGVTMADGRRVILFCEPVPETNGVKRYILRLLSDGKIIEVDRQPGGRAAYLKWLEAGRKPDGVHVSKFWDRRMETTYRGGMPDGPFRAYYEGGELWAEATYVKGRPVGPHVIYDRRGKRIFETVFTAR